MSLAVLDPGFQVTVQDLGRSGGLRLGIPPSGPMDRETLLLANRLVGNHDSAACLECALLGPRLECRRETWVAVAGAPVEFKVNGRSAPLWTALRVCSGDMLQIGPASRGVWSYLAAAGGIDVPAALGSRSTYQRGRLGGVEGRALKKGDLLPLGSLRSLPDRKDGRTIPRDQLPLFPDEAEIRVILGPQEDYFTAEGIEAFLSSGYQVTERSDRVGYRLNGPRISHRKSADIVSDGIPLGGIQVTGDGQPIVLMVDRQSTGGYSKIATVISVDVGVVAQMRAGGRLRFRPVTVASAHSLLREKEAWMARILPPGSRRSPSS